MIKSDGPQCMIRLHYLVLNTRENPRSLPATPFFITYLCTKDRRGGGGCPRAKEGYTHPSSQGWHSETNECLYFTSLMPYLNCVTAAVSAERSSRNSVTVLLLLLMGGAVNCSQTAMIITIDKQGFFFCFWNTHAEAASKYCHTVIYIIWFGADRAGQELAVGPPEPLFKSCYLWFLVPAVNVVQTWQALLWWCRRLAVSYVFELSYLKIMRLWCTTFTTLQSETKCKEKM